ncbi:MAG TPA: hypothetical protein VLW52_17430 [Opitutaceae bacterium]|nr:hypothetical protein [Opitutaceae bacterium]
MNKRTVAKIPLALSICVALAGCASNMHVVSTGNNTYTITREAVTTFARNTADLKDQVREDAAKFCAAKGKQLKVVDVTAEKPHRLSGSAKATIVFEAVDAEAPSLAGKPAAAPEKPVNVDHLYNDLLKLDDLRKKSIITDEEFQGVKKKVLDQPQ